MKESHICRRQGEMVSAANGFGFIAPDDGSADVFLHLSKVEEANLPTLESGTAL
ncbi:cold shock domain-containing protein [Rhizobium lusitanum]|uniref:cold shock domain-containing protein n=1 Tax=Rhizobium lusitanum TaxID=293958 RepID=UPI001954C1EB|nr:cold shock domain-containing protein [Rhizobium lusitanum]